MKAVDPDCILGNLTGRMTGKQVAERMQESSREVVPILSRLHEEGVIARFVDNNAVARFAPLAGATVHPISAAPRLAVAA